MFSFYRGDVLIGHSRLESGDAPMAVATGEFFPTEDFAKFKGEMTPALNGAGDVIPDWRCLSDLIVRDQTGTTTRRGLPKSVSGTMISPNGIAHIQLTVRDVASTASLLLVKEKVARRAG